MNDGPLFRLRPPHSIAEGVKWLGITIFCVVAGYAAVAIFLMLIGVWGGE